MGSIVAAGVADDLFCACLCFEAGLRALVEVLLLKKPASALLRSEGPAGASFTTLSFIRTTFFARGRTCVGPNRRRSYEVIGYSDSSSLSGSRSYDFKCF